MRILLTAQHTISLVLMRRKRFSIKMFVSWRSSLDSYNLCYRSQGLKGLDILTVFVIRGASCAIFFGPRCLPLWLPKNNICWELSGIKRLVPIYWPLKLCQPLFSFKAKLDMFGDRTLLVVWALLIKLVLRAKTQYWLLDAKTLSLRKFDETLGTVCCI